MATDKITVEKKKGQGAMSKSVVSEKRQEKQSKHKSTGFSPSKSFKIKAKRRSFSVGENKNKIETAVRKWTNKKVLFWESNGKKHSLQVFCGVVGIPYNTLMNYAGEKKLINREVSRAVGCHSLISSKNHKLITYVMVRKDHTNEGMAMAEGVDIILEVIPQLYWKQAQK